MTLLPEVFLSQSVTIGYGPGSGDLSRNGNPVWVIATKATTLYVDLDGNHATGPLTDPDGRKYDYTIAITPFQSYEVYDNSDNDQTGMQLYTIDGTKIAAAWGQDPAEAGPSNPFLDMGTTIPPSLVFNAYKAGTISVDNDGDKRVDPNDEIIYQIVLTNRALYDATNVTVADTLIPQLQYVPNSTFRKSSNPFQNGPIPDSGVSPFPLDEGGTILGTVAAAQNDTIEFRALALGTVVGLSEIKNTAKINIMDGTIFTPSALVPVDDSFVGCSIDFTNSLNGTSVSSYEINSTVFVKLTAAYLDTSNAIQKVTVSIYNDDNGDTELLTLTETTGTSGIFVASLPSSNSGGDAANDGILKAGIDNIIGVTFTNNFYSDNCVANATITPPVYNKPLYLSTNGSGSPDQDLDRIHPGLTSPVDITTASSEQIGYVSVPGVSNGMAIWHSLNDQTPNYKTYNGSTDTFSSETNAPSVNNNKAGVLMSAQSPIDNNEAFLLEINDAREIYLHRWDGTNWTAGSFNPVGGGTVNDKTYFGAQIAYSPNGNALLVWDNNNADDDIHYRTWNGTSKVWSAEMAYTLTSGPLSSRPLENMRLAASPISNEMVLALNDQGDNDDYFMVWNGSSWGNQTQVNSVDSAFERDIEVAYESITGRAIITYAKGDNPGSLYYRTWNGSVLSSESSINIPAGTTNKVVFNKLVSDPNSNKIALASTTLDGDVWFGIWNGSSWGNLTIGTVAKADKINTAMADVAFETSSGDLMAVFYDKGLSTLQYKTFSGGSWSALTPGPTFSNIPRELELYIDPNTTSNKIMLMVNDASNFGASVLWSGTNWGAKINYSSNTALNGDNTGDPMTFFWTPTLQKVLIPSTTFMQAPSMCSTFSLPIGGTLGTQLYLSDINGTMPANPAISARLKNNGATFIELLNPTYNAGLLTFTGSLDSTVTIPAGQKIELEINTVQIGVSFKID
jgi:uncharacterized repeat protein (TIGR01451 family)